MREADADIPVVSLSDGVVTLRPWSRDEAGFMAEAFADPAIRRYNGAHDRLGRPAPPLSIEDAESIIDEFASSWRAFGAAEPPSGVAFAITDAASGDLVGCCGVDDWSKEDVAQFGYWIGPSARGRGYATRAVAITSSVHVWPVRSSRRPISSGIMTEPRRQDACSSSPSWTLCVGS